MTDTAGSMARDSMARLAGTPAVRRLLRAWDESWAGAVARGIWSPWVAAEGFRPGEGLALAGLLLLVVFDAWAFNLTGSAAARLLALAVTVLPVALGTPTGLYVALAATPFVPDEVALGLVGLAVFVGLARRLAAAGYRPDRMRLRLGTPVILLGALLAVATVTSVLPLGSLRYLVIWGLAIALYEAIADSARDPVVLTRAAVALGLSAALGGLYGLYQYAAHVPVQRAWIDVELFPQAGTRVFSFWGNPNVFALHLLLTAPLLAAAVWTARGRLAKSGLALATLVAGLALALTFSRAGWLGLALAGLFLGAMRDRRIILVGLLAAALAFLIAPDVVLSRATSSVRFNDATLVHRFRVWEAAVRMIRDFWYSGLGLSWRPFLAVYPQYASHGRFAYHAHNHYLETIIELGVIGFAVLHWILLRPVVKAVRLPAPRRIGTSGSILLGAAAAILGALAFGFAEPIFYLPRLIVLAWATIGLAGAASAGAATSATDAAPVGPPEGDGGA